jgi:YesN/AraC family two-component response regulator
MDYIKMKFQIDELLESNYRSSVFDLTEICNTLGISRTTLHRIIKAETGLTTTSYINQFRIAKAKKLLKKKGRLIKDIASEVGFIDSKYFSKIFLKIEGVSPSKYEGNNKNGK